jgi:hypothetical protein
VPWIVESIDGEALGKLRHDLFEQIELCSERMQENENGTLAGLYIAELGAANVDGSDRNVRRPAQCGGGLGFCLSASMTERRATARLRRQQR